jgi:hypothetical protein
VFLRYQLGHVESYYEIASIATGQGQYVMVALCHKEPIERDYIGIGCSQISDAVIWQKASWNVGVRELQRGQLLGNHRSLGSVKEPANCAGEQARTEMSCANGVKSGAIWARHFPLSRHWTELNLQAVKRDLGRKRNLYFPKEIYCHWRNQPEDFFRCGGWGIKRMS